jgi:CRP-like cAMP-binding protein
MEETDGFMRTHGIPQEIQSRVRDYYSYLWDAHRSISASSPTADLPPSLSMEVLLFINRGLLEKVALFRDAGESFIREVVRLLQPMVFMPGDYIIRQGEYGDCMYFLSEGSVEVLVNGARVASLGQGSPFGETALIQGENRMASIRAISYCDVYQLSKADFDVLRSRHPEFDARVRKVVDERMRDTAEKTGRPADSD